MTVAEIRQALEGVPDGTVVMLFDLEVTERYSIDAIDVIYDGEPAVPLAVDFNYNSNEYDGDDDGYDC
jgi:hypothetical protein